jgi:hypothetical protein
LEEVLKGCKKNPVPVPSQISLSRVHDRRLDDMDVLKRERPL